MSRVIIVCHTGLNNYTSFGDFSLHSFLAQIFVTRVLLILQCTITGHISGIIHSLRTIK